MNDNKLMNRAADNIRILAASMVEKANSGHPGGAMGGADFINVLFSEFLVYDPENPRWEGRDKLRKAWGRSKYPLIPGYPNGATRQAEGLPSRKGGERGELKHLSTHRRRK